MEWTKFVVLLLSCENIFTLKFSILAQESEEKFAQFIVSEIKKNDPKVHVVAMWKFLSVNENCVFEKVIKGISDQNSVLLLPRNVEVNVSPTFQEASFIVLETDVVDIVSKI